ncbi:hypothetical protein D9M68_202500 [compost metagenome]
MSDWAELKRLAEIARVADGRDRGADEDFEAAAHPENILALIAENESLRDLYQMHRQTEERQMRDLRAEVEALLERAEYWKQRAKSAEGHLFTSDWRAARHALHMHTALASTPWGALTDAQKTQISSAAGAVIAEVNARREVRMPHDGALSKGGQGNG